MICFWTFFAALTSADLVKRFDGMDGWLTFLTAPLVDLDDPAPSILVSSYDNVTFYCRNINSAFLEDPLA